MYVFCLFPCSQKDRGICPRGERKSQQQIAIGLNILNYLFTQKTILCGISIVYFLEVDEQRQPVCTISCQNLILKVQQQKLFQNWSLSRNSVRRPNAYLYSYSDCALHRLLLTKTTTLNPTDCQFKRSPLFLLLLLVILLHTSSTFKKAASLWVWGLNLVFPFPSCPNLWRKRRRKETADWRTHQANERDNCWIKKGRKHMGSAQGHDSGISNDSEGD